MKPQIKCLMLVFLLSISVTACSSNKSKLSPNDSSSASSSKVSDTSAKASTSSDSKAENNTKALVMEAFKSVLQNKVKFFNTDYKKNAYINDFLAKNGVYDTTFKLNHFAVLDMDGDKIPEVVLELTSGTNVDFYEVLHYLKGEVNGYIFGIRSLGDIKADGTFVWANSAFYNGFGKLKFQSDGSVTTDNIGYHDSKNNNGVVTTTSFVNNQSVTEEAYKSFENEQLRKKEAAFYDFSPENIEKELSINSNSTEVKEESKKQEYINKLDNIEAGLKDLDKKDSGTTAERLAAAEERHKRWDTALNESYNVLKAQLSSSAMKKLQSEEIQWISDRDAKAKKAAEKIKGGTLDQVLYAASLADTTKKRCYELVEKYMQ